MFDYLNTPSNTDSDHKKEQENKLVYDYYNTKIYKNQYEKSISNGGYVKIPFVHLSGITDPNLTYLPTQSNYATKNIYIMKKQHGFLGDYDGELIIEHTPVSNSVFSVYTCFLLKTVSGVAEETVIDKIMKMSFDPYLEVRLNDFAQLNKQCMANKDHSVFVFPSPILISHSFDQMKPPNMGVFSPYKESDYTTIQVSKGASKNSDSSTSPLSALPLSPSASQSPSFLSSIMKEGFTTETVECVPINIDNKEMSTIEMVPLTGSNAKYRGENKVLMTVVNFGIFIVMCVFGGMTVPVMYNRIVESICGNNNNTCKGENSANSAKLLKFTISLLSYFLLFTIGLSIIGFTNNSSIIGAIGVLLSIFIFISGYIISTNPNMKTIDWDKIPIMDIIGMPFKNLNGSIFKENNTKMLSGIIVIIIGILMTLFFTDSFDKKNKKKNRKIFGSMLSLVVVFGVVFLGLTATLNNTVSI